MSKPPLVALLGSLRSATQLLELLEAAAAVPSFVGIELLESLAYPSQRKPTHS